MMFLWRGLLSRLIVGGLMIVRFVRVVGLGVVR